MQSWEELLIPVSARYFPREEISILSCLIQMQGWKQLTYHSSVLDSERSRGPRSCHLGKSTCCLHPSQISFWMWLHMRCVWGGGAEDPLGHADQKPSSALGNRLSQRDKEDSKQAGKQTPSCGLEAHTNTHMYVVIHHVHMYHSLSSLSHHNFN